jgi:glycyl-tRNA synthetase beta chain
MLLEESEKKLYKVTELITKQLTEKQDYKAIMRSLLDLKDVIDTFFETVMVNTDDLEVREARLMLISRVRALFLSVADISYLSS